MLEPYAGKLARPVLREPGSSQDLPGYPTLETNILLVSPRKCAHCCQALGGSAAQTLKTLGHQSRCAAGSPGILLSIEAKAACSVATTCAPSPTAGLQRIAGFIAVSAGKYEALRVQCDARSRQPVGVRICSDEQKKVLNGPTHFLSLILGASGSPPTLRRDPPDQ